ncbi:MAG: ABC transporter permease [Gemmatimonadales bacterium]
MGTITQDLRYALRALRKSPGFTLAAVLTLALGVGANTAIFSVVNALLLRPLPHVARQEELVQIGRTMGGEGFDTFSYPDFVDFRDRARTLDRVAAYDILPLHVSSGGSTERVRGSLVSSSYFDVLGTRPAAGRFFREDEDRPGRPAHVAVLSAGLWRRAFAERADAVGATIRVNGHPFTVIGVAPAGFEGTEVGGRLEIYLPITTQPLTMPRYGDLIGTREAVWLEVFGRRAPGASLAQVQADVAAIGRGWTETIPDRDEWGVAAAPGLGFDPGTRAEVAEFLRVLQGAVLLVLLIACANVANLLLTRATARRRELAVRASLGARRAHLIRQLLTESGVLAAFGAAGGLLLAVWFNDLLRTLPFLAQAPGGIDLSPDGRVLAFTLGLTVLTGLGCGLVPALLAARENLVGDLREGAFTERVAGSRLRGSLVVAQIGVSLVLLIAAGLFVRTLRNAYAVDPGFAADQVLVARLDVELQGYDEARGRRFQDELLRRLEGLPGVKAAGLALNLPFGGGFDTRIVAEGTPVSEDEPGHRTDRNSVTPGYFDTMGIPIVRGRAFTRHDVATAPRVTVINEAIADRLWPGQDPIGKRLQRTRGGEPLTVVGVSQDAKYRSLFEPRRLTFYQPLMQDYQPAVVAHLRAADGAGSLAGPLQAVVAELDPDLPVYRVETLAERLAASLAQQRAAAILVSAFGLLAVALAAIGLYGAVSFGVARRTREFGIRIALGATSRDVLRQVVVQGVRLGAWGLGIGLAGAAAVTRIIRTQLYGVTPTDPVSFATVSLILLAVCLLASVVPARRATRVDPMVALRTE